MSSTRRQSPLTAAAEPAGLPAPPEAVARDQRFEEGVRTLRVGSASVKLEERLLMVIGGIVAPIGVIVVLLGWIGASRTPHVFEQIPYLISGGLFGLALVFLGAFFYFAHWLTQIVKESRAQSSALLDAVNQLRDELRGTAPVPALVATNGAHRAESVAAPLVATERGTMAHRPACAVVDGKPGLRRVTSADGLSPCMLCDPYGDDA